MRLNAKPVSGQGNNKNQLETRGYQSSTIENDLGSAPFPYNMVPAPSLPLFPSTNAMQFFNIFIMNKRLKYTHL